MADAVSLENIIETVTGLVATELGKPVGELGADLDLSTVEGADSVKVLRAVATIEREYDIELEDDEVFGCRTIRELATSVESTLSERVRQ